MDNSILSDSICSDDTEYLLGQNISIREIDDVDVDASLNEVSLYTVASHHPPAQHSPQKPHHLKSTKARSPQRKEAPIGNSRAMPLRRSVNEFHQQRSPEKISVRGSSKCSPVIEPFMGRGVEMGDPRSRTTYRNDEVSKRDRYAKNSENRPQSKNSRKESKTRRIAGQRGIDKMRKSSQSQSGNTPKTKLVPVSDANHHNITSRCSSPTKVNVAKRQHENKYIKKPPIRHDITINQDNCWEVGSEISVDVINEGYNTLCVEANELESEGPSEATEDLFGGEDLDNDNITEKLKELNLAVNYDTNTSEYFDDKVREGAELLSKLFGGNVDSYYSSSRVELTMATNTSNQSRWKRQPLRILRFSDQSRSCGSAQEVSRSDRQTDDRRNDSSHSTSCKSAQRSLSPQAQVMAEQTNTNSTDHSSSFESSTYTPGKRQGSAARKEVRFKDDNTAPKERRSRDHQNLTTDGEFIRDTSAFRAAMDYHDDDDDDDSDDDDNDDEDDDDNDDVGNTRFRQQRERFRSEHDGKRLSEQMSRPVLSNTGDDFTRKALLEPEKQVTLQSSSMQKKETLNSPLSRQNQVGVTHYLNYDGSQWEDSGAPGTNHPFNGSYPPSPHKDGGDQRTQAENVSANNNNSRRLDRQAQGLIAGAHMTSTPHAKSQAVFSPPQSQQLRETERKLNRSLQVLEEVETEIEDAASRKKVVLQEIHVLEEAVKRNKAEVQSSESLVEQYREQATKTRSQLMELELQRDNLQHEIKEIQNCLTRQKQESRQAVEVEKTNGLKVVELSIEKGQLSNEVESLKAKLQKAEGNLKQEKQNYLEKVGLLQDQLHEEQRLSKENVEKLKQQIEDERQKARDSHYERINAIHRLQDESKEMHDKELEMLKNRLHREKEVELETLHEKAKRESDVLSRQLQDRSSRISQLESDAREYEEDISKLKAQVFQEQQKLLDCEGKWKENTARLETHNNALNLEVESWKQKEAALLEKQKQTDELLEQKMLELRRREENAASHSDELNQIVKNKDDEIVLLRGLVRQQEDATRLLGEKLRNEAQEHIRNALEKERESTDLERARHQAKLEEIRDKYESALKQVREELEGEREGHNHLNASVNKMKKEVEKLRELNLQAEQDKMTAVAKARTEVKEEVEKMKDKIRELSMLTERSEKETVLEINEECRKTAALLGETAHTTPLRNLSGSFLSDSPCSTTDSPAREALLNLRSCNDELRQHLTEARKELEWSNRELAVKKQQQSNGDLTIQQMNLFKKALNGKEEEVGRLRRQLQEENERFQSERMAYQKTVERLEKELKQAKASTPHNSPMVNGTSPSESGFGTSLSSASPSPRPGEDSSSARLLRHLQGRVQQLRAQNENLRKSSENESLNESHCSVMSTESVNGVVGDEDVKRLHSALKMSEDKAQRNAAMLSQKMMEMTKLQKMLTHATKENMKLERAYASLQRKIIDSSR